MLLVRGVVEITTVAIPDHGVGLCLSLVLLVLAAAFPIEPEGKEVSILLLKMLLPTWCGSSLFNP